MKYKPVGGLHLCATPHLLLWINSDTIIINKYIGYPLSSMLIVIGAAGMEQHVMGLSLIVCNYYFKRVLQIRFQGVNGHSGMSRTHDDINVFEVSVS